MLLFDIIVISSFIESEDGSSTTSISLKYQSSNASEETTFLNTQCYLILVSYVFLFKHCIVLRISNTVIIMSHNESDFQILDSSICF